MNHSKKLLFQIYQKFYQQKAVLQTAPALTIDMNQTSIENFDTDLADTEIRALISFLLGVQNVSQIPWENALELVEKYYSNQPQWKRLILHYFTYLLEKENHSMTRIASRAQLERTHLYRKLRQLGIEWSKED
jgi:DNA-binding NtrC family response regulator